MVELFAGVHRTLGVRCSPDKLEMIAQVCHPSTPEEEAGRSAPHGHSQGCGKFKTSLCGRSCLKKQLRKLLTDLFFSFALACACSISRCDCKDIQGELLDTVQGGKRRMLTTQSYFTDSCFCCLVFLYFAVLALLAFGLVDSLSWELLFAYSVLRIP